MTSNGIIQHNLDLHAEWMRYVFDHPEVLDRIPEGAHLVIIPTNDPVLAEANLATLQSLRGKGIPVVVIRIALPNPATPQIEVA